MLCGDVDDAQPPSSKEQESLEEAVFSAVKKLDWIRNISRLEENGADYEVSFDKSRPNVGVRTLTKAVQASLPSGYTASPPPPSSPSSTDQSKVEMLKKRRAFLLSLIGTVPVFTTTMILGRIHATHELLMTPIAPAFPVESLILFVFATPVQFGSGWQFYR